MNKATRALDIRMFCRNHWRVVGTACLMVALAAGLSYFGQMISKVADDQILATLDASATTGGKYQVLFERMGAQLIRHGAGKVGDDRTLRDLNDLLQRNYELLAKPADVSIVSQAVPDYRDDIVRLGVFMEEVNEELMRQVPEAEKALVLAAKFEKRHAFVDAMVYKVHSAHSQQVERRLAETDEIRRNALFAAQVLGWLLVITAFLYWTYARGLKAKLNEQQTLISSAQKAAAVAQDAAIAKNNFLATISHELGTPVQTLVSSVSLLNLRYGNVLDADTIGLMDDAVHQIESQTRDLSDYARLDSGRLSLLFSIFSPGEVLKKLISNYQPAAKQKGLAIVPNLGNTRVKVVLDELRFQQIATNLITNAVKYSDKGTITVTLRYVFENGKDTLRLTVEDCGPGIPEEYHEAVFNPFTQVDQSSTRRHEGVGMGLAIVKGLVELFGGSIKLYSEKGQGSRFVVKIPVEFAKDHDAPPALGSSRAVRGKDLLLVDDHVEVLQSTKALLEQIGYRCDTAQDGPSAIKKATETRFDAILLDISMPGMDGFTVADTLRNREGPNKEAPILAISASAEQYKKHDKADLFTTFLSKPVRLETLDPVLQELTCP